MSKWGQGALKSKLGLLHILSIQAIEIASKIAFYLGMLWNTANSSGRYAVQILQ